MKMNDQGGDKLMRKKRSVRKIIIASAIICFVVFALSFVIGRHIGFANGGTEGYNAGYLEGHDNGYSLGYSDGNALGYENGYGTGYSEGHDNGYYLGYSEGNTFGYENGYDRGYSEGHDNGYQLGYSDGNAFGYENGYEKGYDNGYDNGYEIGETHGYDNGYSVGRTDGYGAGLSEGYDTGYENGLNSVLGHGYSSRDPTYAEMKDFIDRDKTNENTYDINTYNCYNFTADVINNVEAENIHCGFVYILFPSNAHALVAFNTIDRGLIYIEPQSDKEMDVRIGTHYWSLNGYSPQGYDDTVVNIAIIW